MSKSISDEKILSDRTPTPEWAVKAVTSHFNISGKVLDPCRGDGVWGKHIPPHSWCEVLEGVDFFDVDPVVETFDWVVGNPPYSIFSDFLRHSFKIGDNILYLIPANKVFNSYKMMREVAEYGGVKEMLVIAPGSKLKFPIGFCVAAVHFKRDYRGDMKISFWEKGENNE